MMSLKRTALATSALIALLAVSGCGEGDVIVKEIDIGIFVKSKEVSTSWNDSVRSIVTTSKGSFNVTGVVSALNGEAVSLRVRESGRRFLCLESAVRCVRVY